MAGRPNAGSRGWVDSTGKFKTNGELVALDVDGQDINIEIKTSGGAVASVALDRLSSEDQVWVHDRVIGVLPAIIGKRTWSALSGHTYVGAVVAFDGEDVVLRGSGNALVGLSIENLSEADQKTIRTRVVTSPDIEYHYLAPTPEGPGPRPRNMTLFPYNTRAEGEVVPGANEPPHK